jgi:hypothetical protein
MISLKRKIDLYIFSLGILFIAFIIILLTFPRNSELLKNSEWWLELLQTNPVPICCFLLLLYGTWAYMRFDFIIKGTTDLPRQCPRVTKMDYESMTFVLTIVLPFVSINVASLRHLIVTILLLIIIGIVCIRTNLLYTNPSLALLGFFVYRINEYSVEWGESSEIILISRGKIETGQLLHRLALDKHVFYVYRRKQ